MIWKKQGFFFFHFKSITSLAFSMGSHRARAAAAAASFASFSCIKSVHFLQPFIPFMHKEEKNIQINLFWHTQPSAERVKSIQPTSLYRLTCLCARTHTHTAILTSQHMDIAFWLSALWRLLLHVEPSHCNSFGALPC